MVSSNQSNPLFPPSPSNDEVDQLLRNAQLRDELEPFFDESLTCVDVKAMPTPVENEFLESMLAWERAPVLPIAQWFKPELVLPRPAVLDESQLREVLWDTIHKLYSKRIVLDFTDHLCDRSLYTLIYRDILTSSEKMIDSPRNYLHWDCTDSGSGDMPEVWLTYYATDFEREMWEEETGLEPPERKIPPFPRQMPNRPL